jgi:hypothetical protein
MRDDAPNCAFGSGWELSFALELELCKPNGINTKFDLILRVIGANNLSYVN